MIYGSHLSSDEGDVEDIDTRAPFSSAAKLMRFRLAISNIQLCSLAFESNLKLRRPALADPADAPLNHQFPRACYEQTQAPRGEVHAAFLKIKPLRLWKMAPSEGIVSLRLVPKH